MIKLLEGRALLHESDYSHRTDNQDQTQDLGELNAPHLNFPHANVIHEHGTAQLPRHT